MTLIAAHVLGDEIRILADGLSCHDKLTITPSRQIGTKNVLANVPGRTTLQKIFPHPHHPFAIVHCGSNQRDGTPISVIIAGFWERTSSPGKSIQQCFVKEFANGSASETYWLLGWESDGTPVLRIAGNDCEQLDNGRYWGGSGRHSLPRSWHDLGALRESADHFIAECRELSPLELPAFPNCFGGHWHHLRLTSGAAPTWLNEPKDRGVEVRYIIPATAKTSVGGEPAQQIISCGEELKEVLRQTFKVKTVRGALKRIGDEVTRERVARLIAIFDEVALDPEIATEEDAQVYAAAMEDTVARLSSKPS